MLPTNGVRRDQRRDMEGGSTVTTLVAQTAMAHAPSHDLQQVSRTELTPLSFLRRSAAVFPDRIAVVHGNRGTAYDYRTLGERVNQLASSLQGAGLRQRDRVATLCPNVPPMVEALFGVPAAGGILVPINTRLSSDEVGYILRHSGARFLFVDAALEELTAPLDLSGIAVIRIDDTGSGSDPYEQFLARGSPEPVPTALADEEETISINYTSGTTGQPKGVQWTHRCAYLHALANVIEAGLTAESVYLSTVPMFHANGWGYPWAVAAVAATHVSLRKVDPGQVWELVATRGVTHFNGAPTVHLAIANHPAAYRLPQPVTVAIAGAPPPPTVLARLRELNLRPIHGYGLTETGPFTVNTWQPAWALLPADKQAERLARQGQGRVGADLVRVVDDAMEDVPRDGQTLGEVVMRGNLVMKGYHDDPAATAEAFRGGWFHSGDLAVMHPDGDIELRDRKKDIIISGGENISSIEVEQALCGHPAVSECAVVAVADERWGERPLAFVALKPGQTAADHELIAFCRERLAHFKCPDAVTFGELPKNGTGKVQKTMLRQRARTLNSAQGTL
jgi:fatty-acyl-CoA synthase